MKKLQIITGGTSGMGLDTARILGGFGPVFIGGRNAKRLDDALAVLKKAGVEAYGSQCDVSDIGSVKAFAKAAAEIAPISNVVNAAGVDFDTSTNEQMVHINMVGTINVTETFLPLMTEGTLLNFSSITGYFYTPQAAEFEVWNEPNSADFANKCLELIAQQPNPMQGRLPDTYICYCATKRFVIYYTMANASRFGAKGLRVISIAPGSFNTPMLETQKEYLDSIAAGTAFKRVGEPDEMSNLIKALLDPKISYLTGCDIVMDGGKHALVTVKQL